MFHIKAFHKCQKTGVSIGKIGIHAHTCLTVLCLLVLGCLLLALEWPLGTGRWVLEQQQHQRCFPFG